MGLLLVAWVMAAMNTAYHVGANDFGFWFWVNVVGMLVIPLVGIAASRESR